MVTLHVGHRRSVPVLGHTAEAHDVDLAPLVFDDSAIGLLASGAADQIGQATLIEAAHLDIGNGRVRVVRLAPGQRDQKEICEAKLNRRAEAIEAGLVPNTVHRT